MTPSLQSTFNHIYPFTFAVNLCRLPLGLLADEQTNGRTDGWTPRRTLLTSQLRTIFPTSSLMALLKSQTYKPEETNLPKNKMKRKQF